jgi:hypothetical protein
MRHAVKPWKIKWRLRPLSWEATVLSILHEYDFLSYHAGASLLLGSRKERAVALKENLGRGPLQNLLRLFNVLFVLPVPWSSFVLCFPL